MNCLDDVPQIAAPRGCSLANECVLSPQLFYGARCSHGSLELATLQEDFLRRGVSQTVTNDKENGAYFSFLIPSSPLCFSCCCGERGLRGDQLFVLARTCISRLPPAVRLLTTGLVGRSTPPLDLSTMSCCLWGGFILFFLTVNSIFQCALVWQLSACCFCSSRPFKAPLEGCAFPHHLRGCPNLVYLPFRQMASVSLCFFFLFCLPFLFCLHLKEGSGFIFILGASGEVFRISDVSKTRQ